VTDLNDMLIFLAVAELGSFTAAAEQLNTPKSNISRRITRLEQSLNIRLLERTTRSLNLTEPGQIYLEHCRRIKEEVNGATQSLEALKSLPSGTLRVCTTVTLGQNIFAPHFIKFREQFPSVKLDIQLTNRRVDLIEESIDVAFRVGASVDSNLISRRICTLSMHLYAHPNYLAQKEKLEHFKQLTKHDCLYMSGQGGTPSWPVVIESLQDNIELEPVLQCDDFNLLYQACTAAQGIALLPDYLCKDKVNTGSLVPVLPNQISRNVDIFALFPSRKGKLPKLTALLDTLIENMKGLEQA